MDYSYYTNSNPHAPPYPLYGLHNLPTPGEHSHTQTPGGDIGDGFPLVCLSSIDRYIINAIVIYLHLVIE